MFFLFFFVMQPSRRSRRFEKKRIVKKKVFFEFRAQILLKNEKKKKFSEQATRTMNDNDFMNLNQLLTSFSSISKVRNRTTHRDDKSLSNKHMIAKMLENRSEKYVVPFLHTFENKYSHCFIYQYNEKCYEKTHKSKYWYCCFDDKIFNKLFTAESDFVNIKKLFDEKKKNKLRAIKAKIQRKFHNLLYDMKFDFDNSDQQRKIEINKKFQKLIVIYNNVLFFVMRSSSSIKKTAFSAHFELWAM